MVLWPIEARVLFELFYNIELISISYIVFLPGEGWRSPIIYFNRIALGKITYCGTTSRKYVLIAISMCTYCKKLYSERRSNPVTDGKEVCCAKKPFKSHLTYGKFGKGYVNWPSTVYDPPPHPPSPYPLHPIPLPPSPYPLHPIPLPTSPYPHSPYSLHPTPFTLSPFHLPTSPYPPSPYPLHPYPPSPYPPSPYPLHPIPLHPIPLHPTPFTLTSPPYAPQH